MPIFHSLRERIKDLLRTDREWVTILYIYGKKYPIIHLPLLEGFTRRRALKAAGNEDILKRYLHAAREKQLKVLFSSVQQQYAINPTKADSPTLRQIRSALTKLPEMDEIHSRFLTAVEAAQASDSRAVADTQVREWLYYNEMLTADENAITSEIMDEVRGIYSFIKKSPQRLNTDLAKYLLSLQEKRFNDFKRLLEENDTHPEILRHIIKTKLLIEEKSKAQSISK